MSATISEGWITDVVGGKQADRGIPCHQLNFKQSGSRTISYVVMHYTGNEKDTARGNANYFQGANRKASAHFFVDDSDIFQSAQLHDVAWHCGAQKYKHAACRNANSIGIEMCTSGNYRISEKTKEHAAELCACICRKLGISREQVETSVLRHYDVTGKKCPAQMVDNAAEWAAFKERVKQFLG